MPPQEDFNSPEQPVFSAILAGGSGTRLWPLSRQRRPKQFLVLTADGRSLLQKAYQRALRLAGSEERVLILGQEVHKEIIQEQLPGFLPQNLLLEPVGRNTAASIGLAAFHVHSIDPQTVMVVLPADHLFPDEAPWFAALQAGIAYARQKDRLVAIGIPPADSATSYGYLHLGEPLTTSGIPLFEVLQFIEKPDASRARDFLQSGEYLWNTGTFVWQARALLDALKIYMPATYAGLERIQRDPSCLSEVYPGLTNISIDHGVMEKSHHIVVVRADFERLDVGSLVTLAQLLPLRESNAVQGDLLARDSQSNIIYTDQGMVGLVGMQNTIVIRSGDVVLVCPKERACEVKVLLDALDHENLERYQ